MSGSLREERNMVTHPFLELQQERKNVQDWKEVLPSSQVGGAGRQWCRFQLSEGDKKTLMGD